MSKKSTFEIKEEKNQIHDNALEIWGREFKFDHEKGLSEWIKNSVDAYIRVDVPDNEQYVVVRFTDSSEDRAVVECIDFVGMKSVDIGEAWKWWGDPNAARRGSKKIVYGGHGNGGKFYMRQMFQESHFVTYREGHLNVFGFSPNRKYGFAVIDGQSMQDVLFDPQKAIKFAGIGKVIPEKALQKILDGKTGFTVVRGIGPREMKNKIKASRICEKIKNHPQARRILKRIPLAIVQNEKILYDKLSPDELAPKQGFEEPLVIPVPEKLPSEKNAERSIVEMVNKKYGPGRLTLRTSEIALERNGRYGDLNRVDFIGQLGVVASHHIPELGTRYPAQSVFIYAECECPILEEPENSSVSNDRNRLIVNDRSRALLQWVVKQVDQLAEQIAAQETKEQQQINEKLSSTYNDFLNEWKNRFMSKLFAEVLSGPGQGPGAGYGTDGSSGGLGSNDGKGGNGAGSGAGDDDGGGDKPKKSGKYPSVRLSGFDDDPLNPDQKLTLDPRHPVVYQRLQDVEAGIYWINTSSPLAKAIIDKYGANNLRWRDYLLQRYVDIFIKEALQRLAKRDPDGFTPDAIDTEILGTLTSKVHEAAAQGLTDFLFDEGYDPNKVE